MKYRYAMKLRKDGVVRIGREKVPFQKMKRVLLERREIVQRCSCTGPCWEYQGSRNKRGYGSIGFDGKYVRTSRLAWRIWKGSIPDKMEVCHRCDNPPCFNPDHLFLGTHAENMRDGFEKGRIPPRQGELHGCSKLTETQVREIRFRYVPRTNSKHLLAKEFGVSPDMIYKIGTRRFWKHI